MTGKLFTIEFLEIVVVSVMTEFCDNAVVCITVSEYSEVVYKDSGSVLIIISYESECLIKSVFFIF